MPTPPSVPPHFPVLESRDLSGHAVTLPQDLPADRALILIGFERSQQSHIDTWTRGLGLHPDNSSPTGPLPWLEVPVIDKPYTVIRMIINGGMRRGIADHALWPHIVSLYTNKAAFNAAAGITSEAEVVTFVIDRSGAILERATGDYTAEAAARLRAALQRP